MMPSGWVEWGAFAQIAGALVTALLAVGTFMAAVAALRTARIAEQNYRAERLPVVSVTGTGFSFKDGQFVTSAAVKNTSRGPIILHRALTAAHSVFLGEAVPMRQFDGIERQLQVGEEFHVPLQATITRRDIALAESLPEKLIASLTVHVVVSTFGVANTEETWMASGNVFHDRTWEGGFVINWRTMALGKVRYSSYYDKCKQYMHRWFRSKQHGGSNAPGSVLGLQ